LEPPRVPDAVGAGGGRRDRGGRAGRAGGGGHQLGRRRRGRARRDRRPGQAALRELRARLRGGERAPPRRRHRRRVPRQAREGRPLMGIAEQLNTYLTLSGALFAIGTFGFLARRNVISMLMSIELMLNGVNLAIVAFGAFVPNLQGDGAVIALMVMAVAAAEATVGLAIVIAIFRNRKTPLVDEYDAMRR